MDILIYLGILIGIIGIGFGGVYLKKKFDIKNSDIEFLQLILEVCDYITSKFEFKYKKGISLIIEKCLEAIMFVEKIESIEDIEQKIILCKEKAIELCMECGIDIEDGTPEIIDKIIKYIFDNYEFK